MNWVNHNIIVALGIILILSIPVMPTLIYGMHSFEQDQVSLRGMNNVNEEEEEKVHSVEDLVPFLASFEKTPPRIHQPDKVRVPFVETHSPPPDQNI